MVLVGVDDGLVDDLLQLRVLQIVADHHFEHLEQFTIGYITVAVHVVDLEGELEFGLFLALHTELRYAFDKLFSFSEGRNKKI